MAGCGKVKGSNRFRSGELEPGFTVTGRQAMADIVTAVRDHADQERTAMSWQHRVGNRHRHPGALRRFQRRHSKIVAAADDREVERRAQAARPLGIGAEAVGKLVAARTVLAERAVTDQRIQIGLGRERRRAAAG